MTPSKNILILWVLFVGLCQSESPVRPNPHECRNIVSCFVDPCEVNECPGHPEAHCVANYCGGCYADFFDESGKKIADCSAQEAEYDRCSGGQVYNKCGSPCAAVRTCHDPEPTKESFCADVCEPKCECPPSLPIWRNEKCVKEEDCITDPIQECRDNLVYNDCGSSCERPWRVCSDRENSEAFTIAKVEDGSSVCLTVCEPRCECPKDAPFRHNSICIPETSCPKKPEQCRGWERHCPMNPCEQHTCPSDPGAACRPHYCGGCLANFYDAEDAPIDACTHSKKTCSGGQVWNDCGAACLSTCEDPNPICTKNCVPRCQCPVEKPIWKDGECVEVSECDATICESNLVYEKPCASCQRTCRNLEPVCTEECAPGCRCPKNLPILHNGVCTTEDMCPKKPECKVGTGMVFKECGSRCRATCANPQPRCTYECYRGCNCPDNAPIFHDNQCIPLNECPEKPKPEECTGGQVWMWCGRSCTVTCDNPRPICTRECVPRCQCPPKKQIWHDGKCLPNTDWCPKEQCTHGDTVYEVGDEWKPDPCTTCTCEKNPSSPGEKMELCATKDCAYPKCETKVIFPKDQCCPVCAEPCTDGDIKYEVGDQWDMGPCTTCRCVETGEGEKKQRCDKIHCDIPICGSDSELFWDGESCCPYCAPCTNKGRVYEVGDSWKPDDCTFCQCYMDGGEKKQTCAVAMCMPPPPHCRPINVPGECCPRCQDTCTAYDPNTGTKKKYEVGDSWKPDPCTHCTCEMNEETGEVFDVCATIDCAWDLSDCPYEIVKKKGMCCAECVKPCYSINEEGEMVLHKVNEPWQDTPCRTCQCVPDDETLYRNECFEIMCDIPQCDTFSELIYDDKTCCPYCSEPCLFEGESFDVGDSWKIDRCTTCECVESEGTKTQICQVEACAAPEEGCDLVYPSGSCCPECQTEKPCEMKHGDGSIQFEPGDEWEPDSCTFCHCFLNEAGLKEHACAIVDCPMPEGAADESCVLVTKPGECCPSCDVCELDPHIEHGYAIEKSERGQDASFTFKCDDGYWLSPESGNKAFCSKIGEATYPVCEKLSISTKLIEQAASTYLLELSTVDSSGEAGPRGLLCDDGWSDREAQLVCKKHGYNFGRAVSLENNRDDFMFTQMSCPRDDDYHLQHCALTRYDEASLPCNFNEVAGLFCYNAAFEYRIKDGIKSKWTKKAITLFFEVAALKYGKPVDLKRGIFKLDPSKFTVTSSKSIGSASKARIRFKHMEGRARVKMTFKKPSNFVTADNCIDLIIEGPSSEYNLHEKQICRPS